MSDETVVKELIRASMDLEVSSGQPPEEAFRLALQQVFLGLAYAVKHSDDAMKYWFPMMFPMEMILESEQLRWNFRLVLRLKSGDLGMEDAIKP